MKKRLILFSNLLKFHENFNLIINYLFLNVKYYSLSNSVLELIEVELGELLGVSMSGCIAANRELFTEI